MRRSIAAKFLSMLQTSAFENHQIELDISDSSVIAWLQVAMQTGENYRNGGRGVRTLIEEYVLKPLNRWIFTQHPAPGKYRVTLSLTNGELKMINR